MSFFARFFARRDSNLTTALERGRLGRTMPGQTAAIAGTRLGVLVGAALSRHFSRQPQQRKRQIFHLMAIQMPGDARIGETDAADLAVVDLQDQRFIADAHISLKALQRLAEAVRQTLILHRSDVDGGSEQKNGSRKQAALRRRHHLTTEFLKGFDMKRPFLAACAASTRLGAR
jgi:hypothetical protein